jgi:hypothetical protein
MSVRSTVLAAALAAMPGVLMAQTPAQTPAPAASATAAATATAPTPATPPLVHPKVGNEMELGRKYTQWFYTAQFDSLFAHMNEETRTQIGQPAAMGEFLDELTGRAGEETGVVEEKVVMRNGNPQYWRTAIFSMMSEPVILRWVVVNGEIWGIGMNPASQAPPIDPVQ